MVKRLDMLDAAMLRATDEDLDEDARVGDEIRQRWGIPSLGLSVSGPVESEAAYRARLGGRG